MAQIGGGGISGFIGGPIVLPILAPFGTVLLPGFGFNGEPSTGVFRRVAGALAFSVQGTETFETFSTGVRLGANVGLQWSATAAPSSAGDVDLFRDGAAGTLAQRVTGANPQVHRVYNTYTDAANYERLTFGWSANIATIGPEALGTGTARVLRILGPVTGATAAITFNAGGADRWLVRGSGTFAPGADNAYNIGISTARPAIVYVGTYLIKPSYTVAGLPAAATATAGAEAYASDALSPVFGSIVAGGGAVLTPVHSDGTSWIVG